MTTATIDLDLPPEHLLRQIYDALAARPDVREPLLRVLLTDEFLTLPAKTARLQETLDEFRQETRDEFLAVRQEMQEGFRAESEARQEGFLAVRQEMQEGFRAESEARQEGFRALRQEMQEGFRAEREARQEGFRALREEMQEGFRAEREQTEEGFRAEREQTEEGFRAVRAEMQEGFRAAHERMDQHARALRRLEGHVGRMLGNSYEDVCRYEINALMDGPFTDPVLADRELIKNRLNQARRNNQITRDEYLDALRPDIIVRENADENHTRRLGIIEATLTFNRNDLETAARRAATIARILNLPADPFVITQNEWPDEADETARHLGVTIIRNRSPKFEPDYDW